MHWTFASHALFCQFSLLLVSTSSASQAVQNTVIHLAILMSLERCTAFCSLHPIPSAMVCWQVPRCWFENGYPVAPVHAHHSQ